MVCLGLGGGLLVAGVVWALFITIWIVNVLCCFMCLYSSLALIVVYLYVKDH